MISFLQCVQNSQSLKQRTKKQSTHQHQLKDPGTERGDTDNWQPIQHGGTLHLLAVHAAHWVIGFG